MNKKALLISLVAAIAGAGVVQVYLQRLESEVGGGSKIGVLVATQNVPIGSTLTDSMLAVREVPEAYVGTRNVRAPESQQVIGVRVSTGLKANEEVLWTDLAEVRGHARDLSGLVQAGMRAINLTDSDMFDGLLRPGDRVDVLFTATEAGQQKTSTVLQNLLVLSVAGKTDPDQVQFRRWGGSVTLAVTAEQAQLIVQARRLGKLTLVLRNPEDVVVMENVASTSDGDVIQAKDRVLWHSAPAAAAKPEEEPRVVERLQ